MMKMFNLDNTGRAIQLIVSSDHMDACEQMAHVYRVIQDEHCKCDVLSCSAKGGFSVYDRVKTREWHTPERFNALVEQVSRTGECAVVMDNDPPLILTPPHNAFSNFGSNESRMLMTDILAACDEIKARKLRMTQFGFLQTDKNDPEFEGVLDAIRTYLEREAGTVETIFFDIDSRRENAFCKLVGKMME